MAKRRSGDRGDTLLELLMAVAVMGIAVVAVTGGIAVSIRMSDVHRKQAQAGAYIRDFAEAVEKAVMATPSGYVPCAPAGTYDSHYTLPGSFTRPTPTPVQYWDGTTFAASCTADKGIQQLLLRIDSSDNRVSETLVVVIRKPCRSSIDYPLDTACS